MEAPEIIYLATTEAVQSLDSSFVGVAHSDHEDIVNPIEYVRKDALIEWAKNMKRICQCAEPLEKAYQTMIDKLNSM